MRCLNLDSGMGSLRTVLDLQDSSRTKSRGLGLGFGLGFGLEESIYFPQCCIQSLCGSLELCRARDSRV